MKRTKRNSETSTLNENIFMSPEASVRLPELPKTRISYFIYPNKEKGIDALTSTSFIEPAFLKTSYKKNRSREPTVRRSRTKQRPDKSVDLAELNETEFQQNVPYMHDAGPKMPKLNTKVIETWINETLKEVEASSLPRHLLADDSKNPLSKFGIDREKLSVFF